MVAKGTGAGSDLGNIFHQAMQLIGVESAPAKVAPQPTAMGGSNEDGSGAAPAKSEQAAATETAKGDSFASHILNAAKGLDQAHSGMGGLISVLKGITGAEVPTDKGTAVVGAAQASSDKTGDLARANRKEAEQKQKEGLGKIMKFIAMAAGG